MHGNAIGNEELLAQVRAGATLYPADSLINLHHVGAKASSDGLHR